MEIAKEDIKQKQINEEIKKKENLLKQTYANLKTGPEKNKILQSILDDYEEYYEYIRNEKKMQYNALKIIKEHLDNLLSSTDMLKENGEKLKKDQADILKKLISINNELQEIPQ